MTLLEFNKFNAETDTDRPQVGSMVIIQGQQYRIKKVDWTSARRLLDHDAPCNGYVVLFLRHKTRPLVFWVIWGDPQERKINAKS